MCPPAEETKLLDVDLTALADINIIECHAQEAKGSRLALLFGVLGSITARSLGSITAPLRECSLVVLTCWLMLILRLSGRAHTDVVATDWRAFSG